tara:strand:- start:646 stop:1428 length:783 start_codon:yes stop_codon:yes gene_type:complete
MAHISFSELQNWVKCPMYHKITYIDKTFQFQGNLHTAFGKAMHHVCELEIAEKISPSFAPTLFKQKFIEEVEKLPNLEELDQDLFEKMMPQGAILATHAIPALKRHFGKFELVGVEDMLYEDIERDQLEIGDKKFKGFVDLIIKTEDGKTHIIDWKTCSWGWDADKKSDKLTNYQLTLYKHFFAKKHGLEPANIETHFGLLKRTAKKDHVEIFRVTSGPKKTNNALNLLHKALYNIEKKNFIKNRLSCKRCELYKTEFCT